MILIMSRVVVGNTKCLNFARVLGPKKYEAGWKRCGTAVEGRS
jgi:hypothetical protein